MLNERETQLVLERFFNDCLKFWTREGCDERNAFEKALDDVRVIKTDPFSPLGHVIDLETKEKFIHYREMDLGK